MAITKAAADNYLSCNTKRTKETLTYARRATILDISNEKLTPLPCSKMFWFSRESITEPERGEVLFLFIFRPKLSELHTDVTRSYTDHTPKIKAAGERSINKHNRKNLLAETCQPLHISAEARKLRLRSI